MIDPDYYTRRNAFLVAFAFSVAGLSFIRPEFPASAAVVFAAVVGLIAAVTLGAYQKALDYLLEALDKRNQRRQLLTNEKVQ